MEQVSHQVGRSIEHISDANERIESCEVADHVYGVCGLGAHVTFEFQSVQEHPYGGGTSTENQQEIHVVLLLWANAI